MAICALDRPFAVFPSTVSSAWMRYQRTEKYTRRGGGVVGMQQPGIRTIFCSLVSMFLPKVSETDCEGGMKACHPKARPAFPVWQRHTDTCWFTGPCMGSCLCTTMCVSSCWLRKALMLLTGVPIVAHPVEHISQPKTVQEFTDAPIKVREGIPPEIICRS